MDYRHHRNKIALECSSTLSMAMITGSAIALLVGSGLSLWVGIVVLAYSGLNLIFTVHKRAQLAEKEAQAND